MNSIALVVASPSIAAPMFSMLAAGGFAIPASSVVSVRIVQEASYGR